jgi:hypothetical protein
MKYLQRKGVYIWVYIYIYIKGVHICNERLQIVTSGTNSNGTVFLSDVVIKWLMWMGLIKFRAVWVILLGSPSNGMWLVTINTYIT